VNNPAQCLSSSRQEVESESTIARALNLRLEAGSISLRVAVNNTKSHSQFQLHEKKSNGNLLFLEMQHVTSHGAVPETANWSFPSISEEHRELLVDNTIVGKFAQSVFQVALKHLHSIPKLSNSWIWAIQNVNNSWTRQIVKSKCFLLAATCIQTLVCDPNSANSLKETLPCRGSIETEAFQFLDMGQCWYAMNSFALQPVL
jgi:hypothetical protein